MRLLVLVYFYPAQQTPVDGNLTGQCVTLNKWFLAEWSRGAKPFSARGDARYVGQTFITRARSRSALRDQAQSAVALYLL